MVFEEKSVSSYPPHQFGLLVYPEQPSPYGSVAAPSRLVHGEGGGGGGGAGEGGGGGGMGERPCPKERLKRAAAAAQERAAVVSAAGES